MRSMKRCSSASLISQTVVMHLVLKTDLTYWREDNIDACFFESVKSLADKLRIGSVEDIFFPQVLLHSVQ